MGKLQSRPGSVISSLSVAARVRTALARDVEVGAGRGGARLRERGHIGLDWASPLLLFHGVLADKNQGTKVRINFCCILKFGPMMMVDG